jgi:hypothetical protein
MGKAYNRAVPRVYSIDGITPVRPLACAEALTALEPERKRIDIPGAVPLSELKAANR